MVKRQIGTKISRDCLVNFCNGVMELYGEEYLRKPTQTDIEKLYVYHEEKHGFSDLKEGKAPEVAFVANDVHYKWGYYLTDEIYPEWFVLIQSISHPGAHDTKRIRYKQAHEAARKDVERAFDVLKKKWAIIKTSARKKAISPKFFREEQHREDDPIRSEENRLQVIRDINDSDAHLSLKADLVEHLWRRENEH
ncbi:protein translocase subunit SecA2, chloroplastic isoform X1 [Tanacetum coccineum]